MEILTGWHLSADISRNSLTLYGIWAEENGLTILAPMYHIYHQAVFQVMFLEW